MTTPYVPGGYQMLCTLELGDIVTLPDGREQTVRAVERQMSVNVGTMAGWVLVGEIGPSATLLSIPAEPNGEVIVYTPLEDVPAHARSARTMVEGVVSYWAPHLPNLSGAMGELGYKVCTIRAQRDPMVLIWRGRELVVFVKSASTVPDALQYWFLRRDRAATERDVERYSAVVTAPGQGRRHAEPAPAAKPARRLLPSRMPALPGRRR